MEKTEQEKILDEKDIPWIKWWTTAKSWSKSTVKREKKQLL